MKVIPNHLEKFEILIIFIVSNTEDEMGASLSEELTNKFGIPRGRVSGPLLFLVYLNDIVNCVISSEVQLLEDDTLLYSKGESYEEVQYKLKNDFGNMYKY